MADNKKVDPADKIKEKKAEEKSFDDMEKFDISKVKVSDFKRIPRSRARFVHPFEGYPIKKPVVMSVVKDKRTGKEVEIKVSPTFIVGLHPTKEPDQDPAGLKLDVPLATYHSRFIRTGPDSNEDVVFDRVMEIEGEKIFYAIVPSHAIRAQICYKTHPKTGAYEVDDRYLLLDLDQSARLMRLYTNIKKPAMRREQMAAEVAGESETSDAKLMSLPTEA